MTDLTNEEVVRYSQADSLLVAAELALADGDEIRFAEVVDQMLSAYVFRGNYEDTIFLVNFLTIVATVNGSRWCQAAGIDRKSYLESRAMENLRVEVNPHTYHEMYPDGQKE